MDNKVHWLLPEGIDEIVPPQAAHVEQLRRQLLDVFSSWGYELVIPPFIEYLDSLLMGIGAGGDIDLKTFKLIDQVSGRQMGIRADMTTQVARIDAHHLENDTPARLCYMGTVLHTRSDGFGGTRSPLQIGAELYGHSGVASDVEVLSLMIETLHAAGLEDVSVDLGHVGIFRGLAEQAGLDESQETALFDALQRKAVPEIRNLLEQFGVAESSLEMILSLSALNGSDVLGEARSILADANAEVQQALETVSQVSQEIRQLYPDLPLHFDLAELRGYHFHTGMVFAAYVPDSGVEVARGGRYDNIGSDFGRARPATGFSTDLKTLMRYSRQAADDSREAIFAPHDNDAALLATIRQLRQQGKCVICQLPGQQGNAAAMGCTQQLVLDNGQWVRRPV
ncbi:MAG: ATP phosphoribosyltransferase regulatory subunit [Chromatiales bacterium]|jgi:ATP phosphoribosyltransferase regulatory subunit